jgi:hypothetical protein
MKMGNFYSTIESYKLDIHWFKPTKKSKALIKLYRSCLTKNQQCVVGLEENIFIDINSIIWAWSLIVR